MCLQAAAQTAETHDVRHRTIAAGSACADAYKNLLEQVNMVSLSLTYSDCIPSVDYDTEICVVFTEINRDVAAYSCKIISLNFFSSKWCGWSLKRPWNFTKFCLYKPLNNINVKMAKIIETNRYVEQINTDTDFIQTETSPCSRVVMSSNPAQATDFHRDYSLPIADTSRDVVYWRTILEHTAQEQCNMIIGHNVT